MAAFWDYFSVLAPSVGLALIFWLVMRSVFRVDTGEREAKAELEEREARQWASGRAGRTTPVERPGDRPDGAGTPPAADQE
ncbi:hypothetical protein F7P69_21095 [Cellulosimicrobium funkei]|nr:hypothetical protein [Cellulosimicrobium funkei]